MVETNLIITISDGHTSIERKVFKSNGHFYCQPHSDDRWVSIVALAFEYKIAINVVESEAEE